MNPVIPEGEEERARRREVYRAIDAQRRVRLEGGAIPDAPQPLGPLGLWVMIGAIVLLILAVILGSGSVASGAPGPLGQGGGRGKKVGSGAHGALIPPLDFSQIFLAPFTQKSFLDLSSRNDMQRVLHPEDRRPS